MTCPRCARDLLALAIDAQARGDTAAIAQPIREAITEWEHEGEARALTGMLARWLRLDEPPDIRYWLIVANRRLEGPPLIEHVGTVNVQTYAPKPCGSCPQLVNL